MKNVLLLNKIAACGLAQLDNRYHCADDVQDPDAVLVRSASMLEMELGDNLLAIARAGAGVNNIPIDRCTQKGIVVFNTPGANANGVKELTIAAMLLAARNITGGVEWAKTLTGDVAKTVEKGKSAFAGTELYGKTLGVIGLGAIGGMVANAAVDLGMNVVGCDPFLSVQAAWNLSRYVHHATNYEEVFASCDYITLHVPSTPQTKGLINADSLASMKDGVKIINLARADLVDAQALKDAIASGKVSAYVTDFPTPEILGANKVIAIPHLGASTMESEDNCAIMAAKELDDYLTRGNITNSVNYPNVSLPYSGDVRICLFHANVPALISRITNELSEEGINIENMINKSKGDNAYTLLELGSEPSKEAVDRLQNIEGMQRVRVIA